MFDALTDKLQAAFRRLGNRGIVTEKDLDEALREVRLALLEADVNFRVVKEFIGKVRERALGAEVLKSLTPAQQIVSIVNEELTAILGGGQAKLNHAGQPPTVIMLVGLQGSGKTTTAAKLALHLRKNAGRPLLVAADVYRPAAIDQLVALGKQLSIPVHSEGTKVKPLEIARHGIAEAKRSGLSHVILDTAGRLHVDDEMMAEVRQIRESLEPDEVLLVADAMSGQDAVHAAQAFNEQVGITGTILTKLDGDARGGAALSIKTVTGVPIKFVGVGEKTDALEPFYPDRLASRILGMGDMLTLIEKAKEAVGEEDTASLKRKIKTGSFDLNDFVDQLHKVRQMGPLSSLLQMMPGFGAMKAKLGAADIDESQLNRVEAIILSMTPRERRDPDIIDGSRRRRIAAGSGTTPHDVNQLIGQFREAKKLMKSLGSGRFPGLGLPR